MNDLESKTFSDAIVKAVVTSTPALAALGINPAFFKRVALNALMRSPDLKKCTPSSVGKAVMAAAERGLSLDGVQACLIPFREKQKDGSFQLIATFVMMKGGLLKLAYQGTPDIAINANCVYEGDDFSIQLGTTQKIRHVPSLAVDTRSARIIAAYATATFPGNDVPVFDFLRTSEIDVKKAASKNSVWRAHPDRMIIKTILCRLLRNLPLGSDAAEALDEEEMKDSPDDSLPTGPATTWRNPGAPVGTSIPVDRPTKTPKPRPRKPAKKVVADPAAVAAPAPASSLKTLEPQATIQTVDDEADEENAGAWTHRYVNN